MLAAGVFHVTAAFGQFIPAEKPGPLYAYPNAERAEFGYVAVPENRSDPGNATIQLAVIVVRARNTPALPDPVFYFIGGPGGWATLASAGYPVFEQLNENRDLVFVDPRGSGYSSPNLFMRRDGASVKKFTAENRRYFQGQGIDITAYNTTEIAADYDTVRDALGYAQINVFASSFGTFVAQEFLRRFPSTIRCMVMSGNQPATDPFLPTSLRNEKQGLSALIRDVRLDRRAKQSFPDFRRRFYRLVSRLHDNPIRLDKSDSARGPRVVIDDAEFLATVSGMLQRTQTIQLIPLLVSELEEEKTSGLVRRFFASSIPPSRRDNPFGMYLSVLGTDFAAPGYVNTTIRGMRGIRPESLVEAEAPIVIQLAQLVEGWKVPYAPGTTRTLPVSDVPTLLLNGKMDAQTSVNGGATIASRLSNAYNYVFPRIGHAVGFENGPAMDAAIAFVNTPSARPPYSLAGSKRPGFYKSRPPRSRTRGIDDWKNHLVDPPPRLID